MQARIGELERELDDLDALYSSRNSKIVGDGSEPVVVVQVVDDAKAMGRAEMLSYRDINNGTVADDMPPRAELISRMARELASYGEKRAQHKPSCGRF